MNKKRALLISYYFPPCGGAPVQRWHRFLPRLIDAGWDISVLTTSGGDYPYLDPSLVEELPKGLKVYRTPAPALGKTWKLIFGKGQELPHGDLSNNTSDPLLKRILIWIRLNLIIPDMRVFWVPSALRKAKKLIPELGIRVVITTGPPHSSHLTGLMLKRRLDVTWVADWRDPWSGIYYLKLNPPSAFSMRIHRFLERKVCAKADLNLLISRHLSNTLPSGNKMLLRNGFDEEAVLAAKQRALLDHRLRGIYTDGVNDKDGGADNGRHTDGKISFCYAGQITAGQDLEALIKVMEGFKTDPRLCLRFIGSRLSEDQIRILDRRLGSFYEVLPFLPHQEALTEMASARILLMLINNYPGFEGMLTTKLYEYLGVGVPILAIGPGGGEAEELISACEAGICVDSSDTQRAREWILKCLDNSSPRQDGNANTQVSKLGSTYQSGLLISALEEKIGIDKKSHDLVL